MGSLESLAALGLLEAEHKLKMKLLERLLKEISSEEIPMRLPKEDKDE